MDGDQLRETYGVLLHRAAMLALVVVSEPDRREELDRVRAECYRLEDLIAADG